MICTTETRRYAEENKDTPSCSGSTMPEGVVEEKVTDYLCGTPRFSAPLR
jgi:hypothetical protein